MCIAIAVIAKIGMKIAAVAVLEVSSVKNVNRKQVAIIIKISGKCENKPRFSPIHSANPEHLNPLANAMPPPKSKRIPQGIFIAHSQSSRNSLFLKLTGIKNSKIADPIATVASLT